VPGVAPVRCRRDPMVVPFVGASAPRPDAGPMQQRGPAPVIGQSGALVAERFRCPSVHGEWCVYDIRLTLCGPSDSGRSGCPCVPPSPLTVPTAVAVSVPRSSPTHGGSGAGGSANAYLVGPEAVSASALLLAVTTSVIRRVRRVGREADRLAMGLLSAVISPSIVREFTGMAPRLDHDVVNTTISYQAHGLPDAGRKPAGCWAHPPSGRAAAPGLICCLISHHAPMSRDSRVDRSRSAREMCARWQPSSSSAAQTNEAARYCPTGCRHRWPRPLRPRRPPVPPRSGGACGCPGRRR